MQVQQTIPILRIFDYQKAQEFYINWLGFEVVWEHRFEPGMPVYLEIERGGMRLHLSEHHGDATPGARVFVWCTGLAAYHEEVLAKQYAYNRPGLTKTFYDSWIMEVTDPFGNRISFNERINNAE